MQNLLSSSFYRWLLVILIAAGLAACGGTSSSPGGSGGNLSLKIAAPAQYPAGVPLTITMTMTNTSNVNGTNLVYTVPSATNYTGVDITINPSGIPGNNCTSIAAGQSCQFTATIPSGSHPGSFTVLATPSSSAQSLTINSTKAVQAGSSISVTANLGLVDIPTTQNSFYILPSDQVISAGNGNSIAYISVYNQNYSGDFASLNWYDQNGVMLTNVTLVGTQLTAVGQVNTYSITIPSSQSVQNIQVSSGTGSCPMNIGSNNLTACSNIALINVAPSGAGIVSIQPNYFNMSESYESQIVTISNVGSGPISGLTLPTVTAPFSIAAGSNTCTSSLTTGANCQFTLVYTPNSTSGQGSFVVSYNNGTSVVNTSVIIPYSSGSAPYALLTMSPASFSLSESKPLQMITISNTGSATATGLTLPTLTTPLTESTTTCGSSLLQGSSCTYTVYIDYTQLQAAGNESVTFTYNNGQQTQTVSSAVDWATSPRANIVTNTALGFGYLANNNTQTMTESLTIFNTGSLPATSLSYTLTGATNFVINSGSSTCTSGGTINVNESCVLSITFGPSSSIGYESALLNIGYTSGSSNFSTTVLLNGNFATGGIVLCNTISGTSTCYSLASGSWVAMGGAAINGYLNPSNQVIDIYGNLTLASVVTTSPFTSQIYTSSDLVNLVTGNTTSPWPGNGALAVNSRGTVALCFSFGSTAGCNLIESGVPVSIGGGNIPNTGGSSSGSVAPGTVNIDNYGNVSVCTGSTGTDCYRSINGGNWSAITGNNLPSQYMSDMVVDANTGNLMGTDGESFWYAPLNESWVAMPMGNFSGTPVNQDLVVDSNGVFTACNGSNPFVCYQSNNGSAWTAIPVGSVSGAIHSGGLIVAADNSLIACDTGTPFTCYSSSNGQAWVTIPAGASAGSLVNGGIAANVNGAIVACTSSNGCFISTAGSAWVAITGSVGSPISIYPLASSLFGYYGRSSY